MALQRSFKPDEPRGSSHREANTSLQRVRYSSELYMEAQTNWDTPRKHGSSSICLLEAYSGQRRINEEGEKRSFADFFCTQVCFLVNTDRPEIIQGGAGLRLGTHTKLNNLQSLQKANVTKW